MEKPKYCPTPLSHTKPPDAEELPRKKPKLEYIPLPIYSIKPKISTEKPKNATVASGVPAYVPSKTKIDGTVEKENKNQEDLTSDEVKQAVSPKFSDNETDEVEKTDENGLESEQKPAEVKESNVNETDKTVNSQNKENIEEQEPFNGELSVKNDQSSSKSKSSSSSSRSHKDQKHKKSSHKPSSSDKHRSSSSSSKHRSSSSSKAKELSGSEEKPTSSKDHKSSSSRHKSSSSGKERRHSSSNRHSSSSKNKHKDREKDGESNKTRSNSKESEKKYEKKEGASLSRPASSPEPDYSLLDDDDMEEDDVLEQCKAIFEEYKPDPSVEKPKVPQKPATTEFDLFEDASAKKRVAYDGATKPLLQVTQKNLKLNPMQQIYKRQEAMRKMVEAQVAAKTAASANKVNSSPSLMRPSPSGTGVPVRPRPAIAPVSNMLAIKYAKAKLDALQKVRAMTTSDPKPSTSAAITIAQTANKFYGRKAHVAKIDTEARPAPPVLEVNSTKISYNIRMQYYNMMVKHCLIIYPNCEDAWDRAQTEELAVMKKCNTPNIYKSSALLTVNKLRKEAIDSGNVPAQSKTVSHDLILAGKQGANTSWQVNKKLKKDNTQTIGNFDIMPGEKAYKLVLECIATEEQLKQYGYPRGEPGHVKIYSNRPPLPPNKDERYCCRCSKVFSLDVYEQICVDECNYHPKSAGFRRGSADNFHYCCQQPAGSPGCMYANYHVTDYLDYDNLKGFVRTLQKDNDNFTPTKRDIFAFDCEMCYTTSGFELTRITVVNFDEKVVYDSLVKPDSEVVDYNTTYSGITAEQLDNVKTNLREVQAVLLSMFHADSILIGHSLESDMKVVKLLHNKIVDTSMLFPHKMGFPKKRALKTLCIENLKKIIQESGKLTRFLWFISGWIESSQVGLSRLDRSRLGLGQADSAWFTLIFLVSG